MSSQPASEIIQIFQDLNAAKVRAETQLLNVPMQTIEITTDFTLEANTHSNKFIRVNSPLPITITVPKNISLNFITDISSDGTTWTVTSPNHLFSVSDEITIQETTNYNGDFVIASVIDANTFTITNAANHTTESSGGVRLSVSGFSQHFFCVVSRVGDGTVTFVGEQGVIIDADTNAPDGNVRIFGKYTGIAVHYVNVDKFQIYGDIY